MQVRRWIIGAAVAGLAATVAAPAQAITIGSVQEPPGSMRVGCNLPAPGVLLSAGSGSPSSWVVPADGVLTSWSRNLATDPLGGTGSLVVLRPDDPDAFGTQSFDATIVAVDERALPTSPPPSGIATFQLPSPVPVRAGDRIAAGSGESQCAFSGRSIPSSEGVVAVAASPLAAGTRLGSQAGGGSSVRLNLAAELTVEFPVGLAAAAGSAAPGELAPLSITVANGSPNVAITGDVGVTVPDGLAIERAVVPGGECSVSGQAVSCPVAVGAGSNVPVVVLVRAPSAGSYTFTAALRSPQDTSRGDDDVAATLTVASPAPFAVPGPTVVVPGPTVVVPAPAPALRCVVPGLRRTPAAVARNVLRRLSCGAARTTRVRVRGVPRGTVVRTRPGAGTYAEGRRIGLVVSAGPPRRARRG